MKLYIRFVFILFIFIANSNFVKSFEQYEKYINSNWGTDFVFTIPPALIESGNSNGNFVKIFINSDVNSNVTISIPGKGFTQTNKLFAGVLNEFNIEPSLAQPYIKTSLDPVSSSDVFKNSAIFVKSDNPITVHVLVKYTTTSEGFTALPINVLGNEYIVSSYGDASVYYPVYNSFPSLTGITAPYDGTEVTFTLGGNVSTLTSSGQKPNESIKKILNKGDVWMISSKGRDADLTGSKIVSSKPIAVISASHAANIPIENKYHGYITEMEVPTYSWGKTYHIPNIYIRKYAPVIRVISKEENTNIYVNGEFYTNIPKSGGIINEAYIELRLDDISDYRIGTISSDKPISVTLYNTGVEEDGLPEPPGDPFQITLVPAEHYLKEIYFSSPAVLSEDAYQLNFLNIIYKKDNNGGIPDNLLIGEFNGTNYIFNKISDETSMVNESLFNWEYGILTIKTENLKNYLIKCDSGFAAYLYGFNRENSYGFTAGLKLGILESKDNEAPLISWTIDCDGIVDGTVKDLPDDKSIRSNLGGVIYLSDKSVNFNKGEFSNIIPGSTANSTWNLNVINRQNDAYAEIIFWDMAGNYSNSEVYYKALNTSISKNYENFGSFKTNSEPIVKEFSISNNSDSTFLLEQIELKNKNTGFEIINLPNLPIKINNNEKVEFGVRFTPSETGLFVDSIGYGDACTFFFASHLEATVGSPVIEVSDVSFGDVTVGGNYEAQAVIKNSGVTDLIISDFDKTKSDEFTVTFEREFSKSNPAILYPGEELKMNVKFLPKTIGTYLDSIKIINDANARDNVCLINARSIEPGLVASSNNWGRKRIFRTHFPSGPYNIENENQSISLENTGTTDIVIKGIEISEEINSNAFEFNRAIFTNLKIPAGQKFEYKVQFRPIEPGQHKMLIKYLNDFGSVTITELSGFGTVPKINSKIIKYDTTIVESFDTPSIRKIEITNLSVDEWIYADSISIYDIYTGTEELISEVWANFGFAGFKIDKNIINFPLRLAPGATYILYSAFVPYEIGLSEADFQIISDGIDTATFSLSGYGIDQALTFTGGTAEACVGFTSTVHGHIKNNSTVDINIGSVTITNPEQEFTILNTDITDGFKLNPGESKTLDILYQPVSTADKEIEIVIIDSKNPRFKKKATFYGKPKQYRTDLIMSPALQTKSIGDTIFQKVHFETESDLNGMGLKELEISVKFDEKALKPVINSERLGLALEGSFLLEELRENHTPGEIKYKVKSIAGLEITKSTDLFELAFVLYFPNSEATNTDINIKIIAVDNDCVVINDGKSLVNINPICGDELRIINLGSTKYSLSEISPNPIINSFAEINFGIGITAFTEISIFNSIGEEILKPVNSIMNEGTYSILIDLVNFNSGMYYYIIKSGPFYEQKKFIINK